MCSSDSIHTYTRSPLNHSQASLSHNQPGIQPGFSAALGPLCACVCLHQRACVHTRVSVCEGVSTRLLEVRPCVCESACMDLCARARRSGKRGPCKPLAVRDHLKKHLENQTPFDRLIMDEAGKGEGGGGAWCLRSVRTPAARRGRTLRETVGHLPCCLVIPPLTNLTPPPPPLSPIPLLAEKPSRP